MLYLGRFHVAGAVPLLLRDIDYRFTSSAIATEMYPAYFALLREGRCAISPTLAAMRTEADERRLLLMAGTVLGVDGIARGRDEIQQQWRAASSEQRPRIHRAVVSALDASGPLSGRAVKTGL
jgi:hypothetical protein